MVIKTNNDELQLIDTSTGRKIRKLENEIDLKIAGGAFSYDGELFACLSSRGISVWHVGSGKHLYHLSLPSMVDEGADIPSSDPVFLPHLAQRQVYFFVGKVIYSWQLKELPRVNLRRTTIQNSLTFPSQGIRKSEKHYNKEDNIFHDGVQAELTEGNPTATLAVTYAENDIHTFSFPSKGNRNFAGEEVSFLLSPNKRYFVFSYQDTYGFEQVKNMPASGVLKRLGAIGTDTNIRIFDLEERCLKWTVSHYNQIISKQFSTDSQWLITAGYTVRIWDMASGRCLQQYKDLADWAYAVTLSDDKHLLAIADGGGNLSLWDTRTQKLLCRVAEIPQSLHALKFDTSSHYLVGENNGNQFFFSIENRDDQFQLRLAMTTAPLNFYCHGADIEGTVHLSAENERLMHQRGAKGLPLRQLLLQEEAKFKSPFIFFTANRPVIERQLRSALNAKLPLNYGFWTVSFLRDKASKNNSYHAFLLVEGMDAFGHLVFRRYDLATRIGDEIVTAGYAKVRRLGESSVHIKQRETTLHQLVNLTLQPQRGIFSMVGHTWSLSREAAEILHQTVLADQTAGLIPYHQLGENSLLASETSHNCYSWAREKLIILHIEKIQADLPARWADYLAVNPKIHLTRAPHEPPDRGSCLVM